MLKSACSCATVLMLLALFLAGSPATAAATSTSASAASAIPAKPKLDLKSQADGGDAAAALKYALPMLAGSKTATEQAEGLKYLTLAANAKLPEAEWRLGDAYRAGSFGLTADAAKAITYYQQAADLGNVPALDKLGDLYRVGAPGLPKDLAKSAGFYELAVAKADNTARRNLAAMLLDGVSLPGDAAKALTLLTDAVTSGDASATIGRLLDKREGFGGVCHKTAGASAVKIAKRVEGAGIALRHDWLQQCYRLIDVYRHALPVLVNVGEADRR